MQSVLKHYTDLVVRLINNESKDMEGTANGQFKVLFRHVNGEIKKTT